MLGFFFKNEIIISPEELMVKDWDAKQVRDVLTDSFEILESMDDFVTVTMESRMREYVERKEFSPGQVFGLLRVAITGQKVSPPLFESMEIIGKKIVLERLAKAKMIIG
jgi:glutamyl-tRNA synthetase